MRPCLCSLHIHNPHLASSHTPLSSKRQEYSVPSSVQRSGPSHRGISFLFGTKLGFCVAAFVWFSRDAVLLRAFATIKSQDIALVALFALRRLMCINYVLLPYTVFSYFTFKMFFLWYMAFFLDK